MTATTWSKASCCPAPASPTRPCSTASTRRSNGLNEQVLPTDIQIKPYLDRSDLIHMTTHTVEQNMVVGMVLVLVILLFFLGNLRSALIVASPFRSRC